MSSHDAITAMQRRICITAERRDHRYNMSNNTNTTMTTEQRNTAINLVDIATSAQADGDATGLWLSIYSMVRMCELGHRQAVETADNAVRHCLDIDPETVREDALMMSFLNMLLADLVKDGEQDPDLMAAIGQHEFYTDDNGWICEVVRKLP